jgi:hypothetical protein
MKRRTLLALATVVVAPLAACVNPPTKPMELSCSVVRADTLHNIALASAADSGSAAPATMTTMTAEVTWQVCR